ncbi:hypothetical protein BVX99_00965 [bacterium F16]|nr:hypothetical protein BVX99_00965 [bacterium F16]
MTDINRAIDRALFATVTTLFCVTGAILLSIWHQITSGRRILELRYLSPWESAIIFMQLGLCSLIFG